MPCQSSAKFSHLRGTPRLESGIQTRWVEVTLVWVPYTEWSLKQHSVLWCFWPTDKWSTAFESRMILCYFSRSHDEISKKNNLREWGWGRVIWAPGLRRDGFHHGRKGKAVGHMASPVRKQSTHFPHFTQASTLFRRMVCPHLGCVLPP